MRRVPLRVGILGGGQLARMLALSCPQVGAVPHVFAERETDCATEVTTHVTYKSGIRGDGLEALKRFCEAVDVVTVENEFLNLEELKAALGGKPIYPSLKTLSMIQSKLDQKSNMKKARVATLPFIEIETRQDLDCAVAEFGKTLVLKQARFGYDGKGTFIFRDDFDPDRFWREHPEFYGYAEPLAQFKKELAVIVTRSTSGQVKTFPVVESNQEGGVCQWTMAPARVPVSVMRSAERLAKKVITAFDGVGAFGVEMFLLKDDRVVVNELAPRVHNTGHYTMNACAVSQFEQHLRGILGLPLGEVTLVYDGVAMVNILGADRDGSVTRDRPVEIKGRVSHEKGTWLHWYGKTGSARKRKLGHINAVDRSPAAALKKALRVRKGILI